MRKLLFNPWNIVLTLLCVLFVIQIPNESLRFVIWVAVGVTTAALSDTLLCFARDHKIIFPRSAMISGLIVSGILSYQEPLYYIILFSSIAILSKHIIRYRHHHLFNPANFALAIATLLSFPLSWTIESNIYLIILVGILLIVRLKKIFHVASFIFCFSALFLIFEQSNPLLILSWFFICIMLIEPRTSGNGWKQGVTFGSIVGAVAFLAYYFLPQYSFFVLALLFGNLYIAVSRAY